MKRNQEILTSIFNIQSEDEFNQVALSVFDYQYKNNLVYRGFCDNLGKTNPKKVEEIPFLPISFFKSHRVISNEIQKDNSLIFKSSGTTLGKRSQHIVPYPEIYIHSFLETFSKQFVDPKEAVILALLPNYIEQGDSSLVFMVDYLINKSEHPLSGFYLFNPEELIEVINKAKNEKKSVFLFGVSYALLDFAEFNVDLTGVKVIETGGMKGRRKEMIKEELHEILKTKFKVKSIYSEYGMTELMSQAYTDGTEFFRTPPWMKICIRDVNDPLELIREGKTGGVNVIDLANFYSCSFIATDDLGLLQRDKFKILGRFDSSDIRGCNLLVN
ncbi:MAG TPA: hypothetical protein VKX31_00720 [Brumimicrobium sp.]|nr:hypothetical protein [Brumimicrobium sp.]